jgi:hypothetical protein
MPLSDHYPVAVHLFSSSCAMNAPFLTPIQGGKSLQPSEAADAQMEQVRDLLIGDHQRETAVQLAALSAHIRDVEARLSARLEVMERAIEARLTALSEENRAAHLAASDATERKIVAVAKDAAEGRRAAFDALSQGIHDLTNHIQRVAKT